MTASENRMVLAEIRRDGIRPPKLGRWEAVESDGGRFMDPLVDALRTVAESDG